MELPVLYWRWISQLGVFIIVIIDNHWIKKKYSILNNSNVATAVNKLKIHGILQ